MAVIRCKCGATNVLPEVRGFKCRKCSFFHQNDGLNKTFFLKEELKPVTVDPIVEEPDVVESPELEEDYKSKFDVILEDEEDI